MPKIEDKKNRIEWIDTAKGICITLVVLNHAAEFCGGSHFFAMEMRTFRMPLYFILSGLFFKEYESFAGFVKRKTNKLLIPFMFFLIFTSILPALFMGHPFTKILDITVNNGPIYNYAIWFLMSLFEVNILFYLLSGVMKCLPKLGGGMAIVIGCIGLSISYLDVELPLYFGTSLTVMPFFAFGYFIGRKTTFLRKPINYKFDMPLMLVALLTVALFSAPVDYSTNTFSSRGYLICYPCGIIGTIMVLTLSKMIGRAGVLSYWGRYSIIILCTHMLVLSATKFIMTRLLNVGDNAMMYIIFAITMICQLAIILVCVKLLPHVTAQKDLILVNNLKSSKTNG